MRRRFLIDTETASDDAAALIMALRSPDVQVVAITTVAGNVGVEQATRNALYTTDLCGANVPVYAGSARPLLRPLVIADWFHGRDGLGDRGYPAPRRAPEREHAVDAIIAKISSNPGIELVTLGPLTNIALALARAPEIVRLVSRCVVMGGAPCCEGNVTPAAEYNMWVDPEAARMVFHSGLPIEMVGWQLSRGPSVLAPPDIEIVQSLGTEVASFVIDCNSTARHAYQEQTGEDGIALPDAVAMAVALDDTIGGDAGRDYLDIETSSELTRGMTVVDRLNVADNERNRATWAALVDGRPNAKVYWTINAARWKQSLYSALR